MIVICACGKKRTKQPYKDNQIIRVEFCPTCVDKREPNALDGGNQQCTPTEESSGKTPSRRTSKS